MMSYCNAETIKIAPIAIFIYKRESKFRELINLLRKLKPKQLFIISDGPKTEKDLVLVNKTRSVVSEIDWEVSLFTNFSKKNNGFDTQIPKGLDWVFENTDKCIILEDDRIVDKSFFYFASHMLEKYSSNPQLAYIAGNTPVKMDNILGDYFFSKIYILPTWATWRNVWNNRVKDIRNIEKKDFEYALKKNLSNRYKRFIKKQISNYCYYRYETKIPDWAFMWQLNCYINDLMAIYHKNNLSINNGNDQYAYHPNQVSTIFNKPPQIKEATFPIIDPPIIDLNESFIKKYYFSKYSFVASFYKKIHRRLYKLYKIFT